MIYGPGSKGNFPKLISFAKKSLIFPKFKNKRSMLFIDNLSNNVKYFIDNESNGVFFPQNNDYMCTTEIVRNTAKLLNKRIWYTRLFNPLIYIFRNKINIFNKLFSDLYFDMELTGDIVFNNVIDLKESIYLTYNKL